MSADILSQRNSRCVCVGGLLLTDTIQKVAFLFMWFLDISEHSRCFYMLDAWIKYRAVVTKGDKGAHTRPILGKHNSK